MRSDYVCFTVPASLQVQGHRAIGRGIAKRAKVDQKGRVIFYISLIKKCRTCLIRWIKLIRVTQIQFNFNFNRFIWSFTVLQTVNLKKRPTLTIVLHTAWTPVLSVWVVLFSNTLHPFINCGLT